MPNEPKLLIIKKESFNYEDYMKPLKVSTELHHRVKAVADKTNQPLSKIACLMIEFALAHTQIED